MTNQKGVSMIVLVITIIVMIILAAIAVVTGTDAYKKAEVAKFTSEFSDFSTLIKKEYHTLGDKHASDLKTDDQLYYMIATGSTLAPGEQPIYAGKVTDIEYDIFPDPLKGDDYFEITDDRNIDGWKEDKVWQYETEKHYVTDKGEAFILPGFLHETIEGKKWYINESKYYFSDKPINVEDIEVVTPPDDNPGIPPVDDPVMPPPVDPGDNPVTPPDDTPEHTVTSDGNTMIVDGVRIRTIGDIGDIVIGWGKTLEKGVVFSNGPEVYYVMKHNDWLSPDEFNTDLEGFLSSSDAIVRMNPDKGFVTPGPGIEAGDMKLEGGRVYVFTPYVRYDGDWNNKSWWRELVVE